MKKIYRRALLSALLLALCVNSKAQIGYQVALLNAATGEPRAGETVSVDVTLSDKNGKTIYNQKQSATANDFGILSLSVGNANMFDGVDWNTALPLSISVTADNKLVAKSQILHVPVAEYAKQAGFVLTKEMVVGTWHWSDYIYEDFVSLSANGEVFRQYITRIEGKTYIDTANGSWEICNNNILLYLNGGCNVCTYVPNHNYLIWGKTIYRKQ